MYYFLSISFLLPCSWSGLLNKNNTQHGEKMFKGGANAVKFRLYLTHKQWLYCALRFLTSSKYNISWWRINFTNLLKVKSFLSVRYDAIKTTVNSYPNDYSKGFLRFTPGWKASSFQSSTPWSRSQIFFFLKKAFIAASPLFETFFFRKYIYHQ